ncbi:MAG: tetratricopeptide repeat protein [Deltaproteobacteria bacterium]|nr:tetratricopeptide repeat protein [Deltaproteobacteria bacterium]
MKRPATATATSMATATLVTLLVGCATIAIPKTVKVSPVEQLKQSASKIDFAISATKEMIQRSRGASYMPDMYMRLAELYTERARHAWLIVYETKLEKGETSRNFDAPETRLLKNLAIGIYERIPREFPRFSRNDEALFLMAHEYRELGEFENMKANYERLIASYPKSPHRLEAFLVLGDASFDRGDLEKAELYYNQVLAEQTSKVHALARYKLGWVRINKEDCKGAVAQFEKILKDKNTARGVQNVIITQKSINLMREALSDIAYCYPDVFGNKPANTYLRGLAASSSDYVASIRRAANRFALKQMYAPAAAAIREVLDAAAGDEEALEAARKLYDNVLKANLFDHSAEDVERVGRVYEKRYFDTRLEESKRTELETELEVYARDIATKTHLLAKEKKKPALHSAAADAYVAYLRYFPNTKASTEMQQNRADALMLAERHFEAATAFERIAARSEGDAAKQARVNAISEYQKALEQPKLSRFERVSARGAIRTLGRVLLADLGNDQRTVQIKLSIARSHYDSGDYLRASELFFALARQYPQADEGLAAAQLSLDALRSAEDFEGMVTIGKLLLASLSDPKVKQDIGEIVKKAEQRQIAEMTIMSGADREEQLQSFARRNKGTAMGEQALYNALIVARNNDADKFYDLGREFLEEYPRSNKRVEVMKALAGTATDRADFSQAAAFLSAVYEIDPAAKDADERLYAATVIRAFLGDAKVTGSVRSLAARAPDKLDSVVSIIARSGNLAALEELLAAGTLEGAVGAMLKGFFAFQRGDKDEAVKALTDALKAKATTDEANEALAKARFMLAELTLDQFTGYADTGDAVKTITEKGALLQNVDKAYAAVLQSKDADLAIAALARLAVAYDRYSETLKKVSLPDGISAQERQQLQQVIASRADEAEKRGAEFKNKCAQRTKELLVFTDVGRACLAGQAYADKIPLFAQATSKHVSDPEGSAGIRQKLVKAPKSADLLVQLAELYLGAGDLAMALLILDRAEDADPKNAQVHNLRGVALHRAQDPTSAYAAFKKALSLDGSFNAARLNLAAHYAFFGFDDKAQQELQRAGGTFTVRGDAGEHPELQGLQRLTQPQGEKK